MKPGQRIEIFSILRVPDRAVAKPALLYDVPVVVPPVQNRTGRCNCDVVYRVTKPTAARIREAWHLSPARTVVVCACYGTAGETEGAGGVTYNTLEVSNISGLSLRQLQWYDEQSVVCPRHEGHARVYSEQEVIDLVVVAELRRKGISLQRIRRIVVTIRKQTTKPGWLATDGRKVYFENSQGWLIQIICDSKEGMYVVDLGAARARVMKASKGRAA